MLNKKGIEKISNLEPIKRYKYFIKKIADLEEIWILINKNQDLAISNVENNTLIPLWSASEFVDSCLNGIWGNYLPLKLTLDNFGDNIVPLIKEKNYLIDVFPVKNKSGFIVSLEEFIIDLNEELTKYA